MQFYSRKPTRIPGYDYSKSNYYFITICTHEKKCIFGSPNRLNVWGNIANDHISRIVENYPTVKVDKHVVMPNHVHLIIVMEDSKQNPDISLLVGLYKTGVTKRIRQESPEAQIWQRSFHDHIIRSKQGYEKIWTYIDNNPIKWEMDCFYVNSDNVEV